MKWFSWLFLVFCCFFPLACVWDLPEKFMKIDTIIFAVYWLILIWVLWLFILMLEILYGRFQMLRRRTTVRLFDWFDGMILLDNFNFFKWGFDRFFWFFWIIWWFDSVGSFWGIALLLRSHFLDKYINYISLASL